MRTSHPIVRIYQLRLLRRYLSLWDFAAIGLVCVWISPWAWAKPSHKAALVSYYGDQLPQSLRSCQLCHLTDTEIDEISAESLGDEAQPWNSLGRALFQLGQRNPGEGDTRPSSIIQRLRELADADTDGDGIGNEMEILAGTWPGDAQAYPHSNDLASLEKQLSKFRLSVPDYAWQPTEPVIRPPVPSTLPEHRAKNPIDAFIAAEYARQGLKPQPEAVKEVWLRRVYIDLIGLTPTAQQMAEFLMDESPEAYANTVDQLLASPQYGERWGRHWMDIWRYSDWAGWGEQVRDSHPHMWRWRDWIIESLNEDKPYSDMILEMLAADELKPEDEQALRATGFLVRNYKRLSREQWMLDTVDHTSRAFLGVTFKCAQCHDHMYDPLLQEEYYQFRACFEPYQVRIDQVPGQLDTKQSGLSRIYDADPNAKTLFYLRGDERTPDADRPIVPGVPEFLGGGPLTYQAIDLPHFTYYPALRPTVLVDLRQQAAAAVIREQTAFEKAVAAETAAEQTQSADRGDVGRLRKIAQARLLAAQAEQAALEARIVAEQAKFSDRNNVDDAVHQQLNRTASRLERDSQLAKAEADVLEAQQAITKVEQAGPDKSAVKEKAIADARKKLDETVKARDAKAEASKQESITYSPLGEVYSKVSSGRRLALARWLVDCQNPLTARVAVNHLWARHFGRGLVETVDDFGQNGRRPTHPALLDWLAAELMEPTANGTPSSAQPWSMKHLHRLIVLSSTYRLGSEYSSASASIDATNHYLWRAMPRRIEAEAVRDTILHLAGSLNLTQGGPELDHHQALLIPRRSLYFRHAPEKQTQFLTLFDMAAPTECYRRRESIIPQQALALANSELTIKQSRKLARQLETQAVQPVAAAPAQPVDPTSTHFITAAFWQVLGREPRRDEMLECTTFLDEQAARLTEQSNGQVTHDLANIDLPSADPNLRARENLIHVLMNHHEFVMVK